MKPEKIAYPVEEGFEAIGVPRSSGYKAIRNGELRTFKRGRSRMVTHRALLDYVDRLEARSDAQGGAA